jgi:hypothetical protein
MPQGVIVPPKPKMQLLLVLNLFEKILHALIAKLETKDKKILEEFKSAGLQKSKNSKNKTLGQDYERYSGAILVTDDPKNPERKYNRYTWIYDMDLPVGAVCNFDYMEKDSTTVALIIGVV